MRRRVYTVQKASEVVPLAFRSAFLFLGISFQRRFAHAGLQVHDVGSTLRRSLGVRRPAVQHIYQYRQTRPSCWLINNVHASWPQVLHPRQAFGRRHIIKIFSSGWIYIYLNLNLFGFNSYLLNLNDITVYNI